MARIVSQRLDESSWFVARRLPSTYPTPCYKEVRVSPKVRVLAYLLRYIYVKRDTYRNKYQQYENMS